MSYTIPDGLRECSRRGALYSDRNLVRSSNRPLCLWCSRAQAVEVRDLVSRVSLRKERDAAYRNLGVKVCVTRSGGRVIENRGHIPGGYRANSDWNIRDWSNEPLTATANN